MRFGPFGPKSIIAIALSCTLAWMVADPVSVYGQKGGKGRGSGGARSGGSMRGGSNMRGMSGNSMRGMSGSSMRGMSGTPMRGMSGTPMRGMSGGGTRSMSGTSMRGNSGGGTRGMSGMSMRGNSGGTTRGMSGTSMRGMTGSGARGMSSGTRGQYSGSGYYGGSKNGGSKKIHNGYYGGYKNSHGGNQGGYNKSYGGHHGRKHAGYRPSYNHFYYGRSGIGYRYYGSGVGISIGLPLYSYYDYYNVAGPYYVGGYAQPYYNPYVVPNTNVPVAGPDLTNPVVAPAPIVNNAPGIAAVPNVSDFQVQAEQAFRERRYADAARLANHALVDDGENGKLHLFASQTMFALGEYRAAAAAIQQAAALLDRSEWGFVVENFGNYYSGRDYVTQMDALTQFIKDNPNEAYAYFLKGYHYKYLGHDKAAQKQLVRAVELESRDRLAADLLVMAGGQVPKQVQPANPLILVEPKDKPPGAPEAVPPETPPENPKAAPQNAPEEIRKSDPDKLPKTEDG